MSYRERCLNSAAAGASAVLVTLSLVNAEVQAQVVADDVVCNPARCVGRSDIALGAITNGKIAADAITKSKIVSGAVRARHIGTGQVLTNKIANGAVTAAKIAAGAVTADKLAADVTQFLSTIVVSPVGPTAAENCDALLDALDGITDNDADNPYLIVLEPGVYDCGSTPVAMKEFVDIRGSGPNTTRLTGSLDSAVTGVVNGADNAALSSLTVENRGGGANAIAIANTDASPDLLNLVATASNATTVIGISNTNAEPQLDLVEARASSGTALTVGMLNDASSPRLSNSEAEASAGTSAGVGTELVGMLNRNGSSPDLQDATAHAEGENTAGIAIGMRNESGSSPTIVLGGVEAEGATATNIGMENTSASPLLALASVSAENGGLALGMENDDSTVEMFTVLVTALDATANDGMRNVTTPSTVTAHNVFFTGASHSINNLGGGADSTNNLATSQLDGPATTDAGTWNCAYTYDGGFQVLNSQCEAVP